MKFDYVQEFTEELCTNTMKLAILNMLNEEGPKTLYQIMDTFNYDYVNQDLISMEEAGLLCKDRFNAFCLTGYAVCLKQDLDRLANKCRIMEAEMESVGEQKN